MKNTTRLWQGIGACVTLAAGVAAIDGSSNVQTLSLIPAAQAGEGNESGEAGEGGEQGSVKGTFQGDLNKAMENIFAGEGGEGGAGLSPMWPTLTVPALTDAEIRKVVTGNTLSMEGHVNYYFTAAGAVEGNHTDWEKLADAKQCPKREVETDNLYLNGDTCWKATVLPLKGAWTTKNHQLCINVTWTGGSKNDCRYLAILLDDVAFFDATGHIDGKGHKLLKGKDLRK